MLNHNVNLNQLESELNIIRKQYLTDLQKLRSYYASQVKSAIVRSNNKLNTKH